MTKSTKSHQRERSPLFENSSRVHELVAGAVRGECVRQGIKQKSVVLPLSAISYCHACEHITRDSRADSCTHCLHARIIGLAGVGGVCALTGRRVYFLFCLFAVLGLYLVGVGAIDDPHGRGINTYAEHVCRRRRDRGIDRFSHMPTQPKISSWRGDFFYAHYFFERFFMATMIPASISATEIPSRSPEKKSFTGDPPILPAIA